MPYGTVARIVEPFANVNVDEAPHANALHAVGFTVHDSDGRRYRYVNFGGTVAQYDAVKPTIGATPYTAVVGTSAVNQAVLGAYFHSVSAASGQYGWIIDKGIVEIKTSAVTAGATGVTVGASATGATLTTLVSTANTTQAEAQRMMAASIKGILAMTDTASGRSTCLILA